ncbi:MAG TPA: acyltransferase [Candidatus Binatia bacterium]|nr:acyltransferase [Candidatus Binatia bacterium]
MANIGLAVTRPSMADQQRASDTVLLAARKSPGSAGRFPTLDGLRALSILLVLLGHSNGTLNFPAVPLFGLYANFGVRVFFIISGFLITSLLLKEMERTARISLKDFYTRRVLRIFPAFYTFLLVVCALSLGGVIQLRPRDLWFAFTYLMNFHFDHSWHVGHLWSLAVEEQFYLLWPAVVAFCSRRRAFQVAAAVSIMSPFLRLTAYCLTPSLRQGIGHMFPTVADALAIGCFLAGTRDWLHAQTWYKRLLEPRNFAVIAVAAVLANLLQDWPRIYMAFGESIMNVGIAICIDRCMTFESGRVGRILEWRPLVFIGVLSYSLYIWQQLFLNRSSSALVCTFPLNLILVGLCALASYYLVEQPFLRLKQHFSHSASTGLAANSCGTT